MNDSDAIFRLIDANANRAREALRVMEDTARFLIDEATLSASLKTARHDLATAIEPLGNLIPYRDTPADVGITLTTPGENQRANTTAVAIAAGKRLSEALRAIEEYTKIINPTVAVTIESLRYRGYELEKQLALRLPPPHHPTTHTHNPTPTRPRPSWRLCVLITEALCTHHSWLDVARFAVDAGADCIQLREKNIDSGELLNRATQLVDQLAHHASVIINDRPDIAQLSGAHGVHLGQTDLPCRPVRHAFPNLIIGISTSKLADAQQAQQDGADYCGVGPMFHTTTKIKPETILPPGPDYLRDYLTWNGLPALAIGGITPKNVGELRHLKTPANPIGIAVSAIICNAKNIQNTVKNLRLP